jgi:hypothetical protein
MSIPKILTVLEGKVVIDESVLSIPELKAVWETYQEIVYLQYLWARFDPESPYFDYDETERLDKIIGDYPCDINDFTMIVAINKCEELYNSPIRKILMGAKKAVENLSLYLGTSEIESGRDGNLAQIVTTIKSLPQILKAYQEAENAYKMEVQKSRGNTKRAIDEDYNSDYDD